MLFPITLDLLRDAKPIVRSMMDLPCTGNLEIADRFSVQNEAPARWVRNAAIYGSEPVVFVQDGGRPVCLAESSPYVGRTQQLLPRALDEDCSKRPLRQLRGEWALLAGEWSSNFWHWHTEFLPYAIHLERSGYKGRYLLWNNAPLFHSSLSLVGIRPDRIWGYDWYPTEVERLLIFKRATGLDAHTIPTLIADTSEFLRARADPQRSGRRLYIARRGSRKVANEADVLPTLTARGFEKVHMEDFSMLEQIRAAGESECIMGPHGAGMAAALFMPEGGRLIEFFAPSNVHPCMIEVCEILRHSYAMFVSRVGASPYRYGDDVYIEHDMLRIALSSLDLRE